MRRLYLKYVVCRHPCGLSQDDEVPRHIISLGVSLSGLTRVIARTVRGGVLVSKRDPLYHRLFAYNCKPSAPIRFQASMLNRL